MVNILSNIQSQKYIKLFVFIVILLLLLNTNSYCKTGYKTNISAGYLFNRNVLINNQNVFNSRGFVCALSGRIEIPVLNHFVLETGLSGKYVLTSGDIGLINYRIKTLRLSIPFLIGGKINEKLRVFSGASIRNNPDILDLHIRREYNFRYDLILKGYYYIDDYWAVTKRVNYNIGTPDVYLVNDPKTSFLVGLSYKFNDMRE